MTYKTLLQVLVDSSNISGHGILIGALVALLVFIFYFGYKVLEIIMKGKKE